MKLYHNPASPFVAKTRIIIHECGLADQVELEEIMVAQAKPNDEFDVITPLRQIPTLVLEDGTALYDSFVICDYLIRLSGKESLLPVEGETRTRILLSHALINGMMERAVATRYETFARPEELRWQAFVDDNKKRINNGLALLNTQVVEKLGGAFDISEAAFIALMRYLDFRFPDFGWRDNHPALVAPFEAINEFSSVKAVYGEA